MVADAKGYFDVKEDAKSPPRRYSNLQNVVVKQQAITAHDAKEAAAGKAPEGDKDDDDDDK